MAYRDPSPLVYREPAQTELRFFAGTWGSLIVAGFWLAVMSLMVFLLSWWDTQVTGHCDRGICRFGDRVIPFASVTGLEIAEDHDEDGTTSRVVARLNTGETLDFGEPWTNMDDAEKLAFVTTFEQFQHATTDHWDAIYGTTGPWNARVLRGSLVVVILVWLALRRRIWITRSANAVAVQRRMLVGCRRSWQLDLADITDVDGSGLTIRDAPAIPLGELSRARVRSVRTLLDLAEPE